MDEAHPDTEGNLLYSKSSDKSYSHPENTFTTISRLVLDQTAGYHLLASLIHKINHPAFNYLLVKWAVTLLFAFADSSNVYRLLGPKFAKNFVPQITFNIVLAK